MKIWQLPENGAAGWLRFFTSMPAFRVDGAAGTAAVLNGDDTDQAAPSVVEAPALSDVPEIVCPEIVCVDLDGCLLQTDLLYESVCAVARDWRTWSRMAGWLFRGKAYLKARLAERAGLDVAHLPYNETLIAYLREQKAAGRRLVLVTAADRSFADAVANHLDLFERVIASDGQRNLRGTAKVAAIRECFGNARVCYIGHDGADLKVWAEASTAVAVNAPRRVMRRLVPLVPVEAVIEDGRWKTRDLLRALRPYQWAKNLLVFVPMVTANSWFEFVSWGYALLMFLAFCATASCIYIVNDLMDLSADRQHPRKRKRPFASGALPLSVGFLTAPLLLTVGIALGALAGNVWIVLLYAALSNLYSLKLKSLLLIDIFTLAALYTIRLFAGGSVTGHPPSLWLLAFSGFLFLALAVVKRVAELSAVAGRDGRPTPGRAYKYEDANVLQLIGVSASFVASLVLALYVQSEYVSVHYAAPERLWLLVPLILFWQCRIWLITSRGGMHDDPIVFSAKDGLSWVVVAMAACTLLYAGWPL